MIFEFQSREGASPNVNRRERDLDLLSSLHESISEKFDLPEGKISEEILPLLFSELSPGDDSLNISYKCFTPISNYSQL